MNSPDNDIEPKNSLAVWPVCSKNETPRVEHAGDGRHSALSGKDPSPRVIHTVMQSSEQSTRGPTVSLSKVSHQQQMNSSNVPDLEPLAAPQTKEERRMRQRLHVKRTYYRKLMKMQKLRDTVHDLEQEFAELQLNKSERETGAVEVDSAIAERSSGGQQFKEIVEVKAQLRKENEALQLAIAEHNRYALKAASWIRIGGLVSSRNEQTYAVSIPEFVVPVDANLCREIARQTFDGVRRFNDKQTFLSTGVSLFGWRDKRVRSVDRVAFSLTKTFHGITAAELSARGWSVTGASDGLSKLYSASMNVTVSSLRRVDDDNQIKLRVMSSQDGCLLVKTLFLVSRFAISNGYVIVIRSLDHTKFLLPETPVPGVREQWVDYHNWTIFESHEESGEQCRLEFGGEVHGNSVAGSDMWMLEVLLVALRWENIVVGPVISIC